MPPPGGNASSCRTSPLTLYWKSLLLQRTKLGLLRTSKAVPALNPLPTNLRSRHTQKKWKTIGWCMAETDQMRATLLTMSNSVTQVAINGYISCSRIIDRCTYLVKMQPRKNVSLKANCSSGKKSEWLLYCLMRLQGTWEAKNVSFYCCAWLAPLVSTSATSCCRQQFSSRPNSRRFA